MVQLRVLLGTANRSFLAVEEDVSELAFLVPVGFVEYLVHL
jgi:hypothetical protein